MLLSFNRGVGNHRGAQSPVFGSKIEDNPFAFFSDNFHRPLDHRAGVKKLKAEDVAGHVFRVNSNQGLFFWRDLTLNESEVFALVHMSVVDDSLKFSADTGRQRR